MKKNKILTSALAGTLAGCLLLLSACGQTGSTTSDADKSDSNPAASQNQNDESIVDGNHDNSVQLDSLTYVQDTDVTSLVPWDVRTLTPGIAYEIYEMLYGMDSDGEFYPILADANRGDYMPGMDHEKGSADYTIYIYDYITDSAGNKITASDVKFSFDKAREGGFESGWGSFLSEEVVDDTTIVLHCERELDRMGELLNIICRTYIFSEKAFNDSPSGFANDACGTGPYVLEAFTASAEIKVVARDDYWQTNEDLRQQIQQANVKEITMSMVTETTQKVIGLETGVIDVAEKFDYDSVQQLEKDGYGDKFNTYSVQSNMVVYAYCNNDPASPCSNLSLRKAILMAIDNVELATFVGNGRVGCTTLGNNFYPDYDPAWDNAYSLYQTPDAATIKSLLDEAGYQGETLELLTANFCGDYAEVIGSMLANYGINVNLNILDGGTCNTLKSDPASWDIFYQFMAADDYVVNLWSHLIDADGRPNNATENFIVDDTLQDLLHTCMSVDGHTDENMAAFLQYVDDNAYVKALCTGNDILLYPDYMTTVFKTDKGYMVPGACTYTEK
jgi:ABC-type transport system substrate-binding protein